MVASFFYAILVLQTNLQPMKKYISFAFLLLSASWCMAQDKSASDALTSKLGSGTWVVETQFSPNFGSGKLFGLNDPFLKDLLSSMNESEVFGDGTADGSFKGQSSNLPLLRLRRFTNETTVKRYMLNLSYSKWSENVNSNKTSQSQLGLALGYGKEHHKIVNDRLNTYLGWDMLFGIGRIGQTIKPKDGDVTSSNQMAVGVGFQVFSGLDYYIIKNALYVGAELGLGLGVNNYGKTKIGDADDKTSTTTILLTPYIVPAIRLGYRL